tara:strand:+ start:609 stop:767 length:159 start_codon:yes stop_codon:yes gene_type:complete
MHGDGSLRVVEESNATPAVGANGRLHDPRWRIAADFERRVALPRTSLFKELI